MQGFLLAVSGLNGENIDIEHEFHRYWNSTFNMIYWNQEQKGNKNGLQSSQQWYTLDEYLRFDKKRSATVKHDGCHKINWI